MKQFRDMSYRGGSSEADAPPIIQRRYRKVREASDTEEVQWEEYAVTKPNQPSSWEGVFKMQIAAEELTSRRPHALDVKSAKAEYAKFRKRERFDAVKDEVNTGLTNAKTGRLATVVDKD